jgi:membrane dipeptidase
MRKICWLAVGLGLALAAAVGAQETAQETAVRKAADPALVERARKILTRVPLVDGHNDLPWEYRKRFQNHMDRIDLRGGTTTSAAVRHVLWSSARSAPPR